jgi:hypothetical protein
LNDPEDAWWPCEWFPYLFACGGGHRPEYLWRVATPGSLATSRCKMMLSEAVDSCPKGCGSALRVSVSLFSFSLSLLEQCVGFMQAAGLASVPC